MEEVGAPMARPSCCLYVVSSNRKKFWSIMVLDRLMMSRLRFSSTRLLLHAVSMMERSSLVGMLVYMFERSKEASLRLCSYGMSARSLMRCVELVTLNVYGRGVCVCNSLTSILAGL